MAWAVFWISCKPRSELMRSWTRMSRKPASRFSRVARVVFSVASASFARPSRRWPACLMAWPPSRMAGANSSPRPSSFTAAWRVVFRVAASSGPRTPSSRRASPARPATWFRVVENARWLSSDSSRLTRARASCPAVPRPSRFFAKRAMSGTPSSITGYSSLPGMSSKGAPPFQTLFRLTAARPVTRLRATTASTPSRTGARASTSISTRTVLAWLDRIT